MSHIRIDDAQTQLAYLIERALRGEEIVIMTEGKPAVRLAPVSEGRMARRPLGLAKGLFTVPDSFFDPLPEDMTGADDQQRRESDR